mgnify:CR=1 FL=1
MKVFKISILALTLASCGNSVEISNEETTPNNNNGVETEVISPKESHFIIGDWFASAKDAGVDIKVSFSEDGTFSQDMAGQSQTGTWVAMDENQVKIDTENLKNGQVWKITEKGDDEMKIVWSIKDGFSKSEITFRKN